MTLAGFGNHHQTEALPGALPMNQNSPHLCPLGLYAEQISGSAFTTLRHKNLHSWLYRQLPSADHPEFSAYGKHTTQVTPPQPPNRYRWQPRSLPNQAQDFVDGRSLIASTQTIKAFVYQCTQSMEKRYFCNHDGELLFVPYAGSISFFTEMGQFTIEPGMIAVIPRGIHFKLLLNEAYAAGYLCENAGLPLTLPELGPLGANSLANPRHFLYPSASLETITGEMTLIHQFQGHLWQTKTQHSPLNVVAWHGNYAPYYYDLNLFNTINTVSFDHPDPSIFTVLTSPSDTPGVANLDFVLFPPRWMVAEHTFRPPYFHRNIMNELMGLIKGTYDAKAQGFSPGGISIHNCMTAHGPDVTSYEAALRHALAPQYYANTLAFMFETNHSWQISDNALQHTSLDKDYASCWQGFKQRGKIPE